MADGEPLGLPIGPTGAVALLERRRELEPSLASAGEARHLLREALAEADRVEWTDAAELAVSEVVTNAILHAHSGIDLVVRVFDDEVCVEVRDFSSAMPIARSYDAEATTGRGMGLVAALTRSCGIHPLGTDGKVVWFCVGEQSSGDAEDGLLPDWDIDDLLEEPAMPDVIEVELRSMPATLWLSARQHHDALIRELVLYAAQHPEVDVDIATADAARACISSAVVAAVDAAHAAGTAEPALPAGHPSPLPWVPKQLDLRLPLPKDSATRFAALQDVLDTAERLAADGQLLIRPGLPEIVAVRDWACEQVIAQMAGGAPSPWPGTDQERFEHEVNPPLDELPVMWDSSVVRGSTSGVIAADDANRIVAISPPLATLLGWSPDELVGRRVVTVIPPALREAHVAGFSRHLSTGEAHVLGVPLELPVLHRDGREVLCSFMVERAAVTSGRQVYLAWIEPIDQASRLRS